MDTARTPVNKRQGATDTRHPTPKARVLVNERRGAMDTAHATHRARIAVNERQRAADTAHTTHKVRTLVNERQGATNTACTCTSRVAKVQGTMYHNPRVGHKGATQSTRRASSRGGTPRPLVRARRGCTGDRGKHHPEPLKQPVSRYTVQEGVACKQQDPATQATGVRRSYGRLARAIPPVVREILKRLKLHGQNHTKCTQSGPCKKIIFHRLCFFKIEY